jgi:serine/threonine protein kinase/dienelactone hydrolase
MANREQSAEDIFGVALGLPPQDRSAYLDSVCQGSPELRLQVERLLLEDHRLGSFLAEPAFAPAESPQGVSIASSIIGGLTAGTTLGRYTIIEPLGAGGMGVVYRASDDKLERSVAIKLLAPGLVTGEDARRRFHKEARALAKLNHAHVAAVFDVGQESGVDYIVMECVPGQSLAARLKQGPLSLKDATSVVLQIAQALEEAHEHGVVHRDLKPGNVMITPKGQVKVLDFGLAKLLAAHPSEADLTLSLETRGINGTPLYMSPEQANGETLDGRTDLWSLGVIYYEALTGRSPFRANGTMAVLRAVTDSKPVPLGQLCPGLPPAVEQMVGRCLEKDPARRYQIASEIIADASSILATLSSPSLALEKPPRRTYSLVLTSVGITLALAIAAGAWFYHHSSHSRWARDEAPAQVQTLLDNKRPLAASLVLADARKALPADPQLAQMADDNTRPVSITSSPSGATVEVKDYLTPDMPWHSLGVTPLENIRVPDGYFRWRVSKPGMGEMLAAPLTGKKMEFSLAASQKAPSGMVLVGGGVWADSIGFVGWVGPFNLPPYYVDRYEVTNREYQKFVDSRGYENKQFWQEKFIQNGRELSWDEAAANFRDTTGRPGPSTWIAGHYPEGQADLPVSGVSWFEASAYAVFAGKRLPVLAQWFKAGPSDVTRYMLPASNFSGTALAPAGAYQGIGPYGTYDMAGNVREWVANPVDSDSRFILGGSWKSPSYLYFDPEALSPFDRSDTNGFRCVVNAAPLQPEAEMPVHRAMRDFSTFKPVSDSVFHAYELLYAYPEGPLNAQSGGLVKETADWREEKVTFDTGYRGERMSAYVFLPKNVRPPYQAVLFFPSARVLFIDDNHGGKDLGDLKFFDYIVQSGRAVIYPIYQDTYERRVKFSLPGGSQSFELTVDRYKDAARSLDYLATRPDIDNSKLAYLGVSMGSAEGVIVSTLLQDRLKTAVFLDGGYFLQTPPPGGDQADFAPRLKIPVLMVNGRYDFTFPVDKSQDPLFNMLGTPAKDKRHLITETPHDVTEDRPQLVRGVLDWLDHYLGRVNE